MERASSVAEFLAEPIGRYFLGRRHLVFCQSTTLLGHASWGRPTVDDVRELVAACRVGLGPGVVPHGWLVDLRGLEFVEPGAFALFLDYVRTNRAELGRLVRRQAQMRPDGLAGAVIAGFSHIARLPYPERVFAHPDEALEWLGVDAPTGLSVISELEELRNASLETNDTVARLRQELRLLPSLEQHISLEQVARRCGVSPRSLQRALTAGGTSFRIEQKAVQVERARQLLQDPRQTLTSIALEVGFSSVQHFTTAFRRATGETPGVWRSHHGERR